jgi:arylsulfatase
MTERTRRDFLGQVGGVAAAAAAGALSGDASQAAERPNVVLVLADDLGYNDLGCYGQRKFATPNIDRLAAEGARLTAYYSGSPVCAPSRCALLTGLHTGHCQIRDNDEMAERGDVWTDPSIEGQRPIAANTRTVATVLRAAGYRTALIGKWGLGGPGSEGAPTRAGFDEAFGYLCQRQAHNAYPDHLWHDDRRVPLDNPVFRAHQAFPAGRDPRDPRSFEAYRGRQYALDVMLDRADAFVRANRSRPFFLHLTPTIPHLALQVPEDSLAEYLGKFPETPYLGDKGYLPHFAPRAAYAAMIGRLDRGIGRILRTLAETGLDRRTIVIFTSDNGATFDTGGFDPAFFQSNAPWRGAKQELYEGGIRVPFVARLPGRIPAGLVRDDPAAAWDVMATLADLAGTTHTGDGLSLLPALAGGRPVHRDHLYWEFKGKQALRQENWKLWRDARKDVTELYDLQADPGETRNLAASAPDRVARMTRTLAEARTESVRYPLQRR